MKEVIGSIPIRFTNLSSSKSVVEIVPVMEVAAFEPAKREPLEEACGLCGAETMLLAARPGTILWTDD